MILVTGAAGKTGRAIIRALSTKGQKVRGLVHRPEQQDVVLECGAQEAVVADMRRVEQFRDAALGAQSIYHICPNVSQDEVVIGNTAILAARDAHVERFVFHSVLHPQVEAMPHHWKKMRVEEALFESGLTYTILQPAAYMQNLLAQWEFIERDGVYRVPYPVDTVLGMVDLIDVAEAASIVLVEQGHSSATYELAGSEALSQKDVAAILSEELGRPIRAVEEGIESWRMRMADSGMDRYRLDTLISMFEYYGLYGFWGNPTVLTHLLDRMPTTLEAFIRRTVQEQSSRH
ncbi:MAG: NmrA family NAD(P)-binding protein [Anaerolineales bacterium]|nr:NmrA family NAD(P)-binding protein [Anaerolineales bacterium]